MGELKRCSSCGDEYDRELRRGRPGLIIHCEDCAEEVVDKYTGVMIYSHKTGGQVQINKNPEVTQYIIAATKLRNKGSNLGNNLKVSYIGRTNGLLNNVADVNAKGKTV